MRARDVATLSLLSISLGCNHRGSTNTTKPATSVSPSSAKEVVADPTKTAAPPPAPFAATSGDRLVFDPSGKKIVVVGTKVRVFEADTGTLLEERDLAAGRSVVDTARGVLLLSTDETETSFELYDIASAKTSKLPDSWFPRDPDQAFGERPSLSANGDRLAVFLGGDLSTQHQLEAAVYDTNRRVRVAKLAYRASAMAGGAYFVDMMPDGKAVKWCHTRLGPCSLESIDGTAAGTIGHYTTGTSKWTIEVPWDFDSGDTQRPQIRDTASGQVVGSIAKPPGLDAPSQRFVVCPDSDRAVAIVPPTLFVYALPRGNAISKFDVGGTRETESVLACAGGGHRIAWSLVESGKSTDIEVRKID